MINIFFWKLYFYFRKTSIKLKACYFKLFLKSKAPSTGLFAGLVGCGNFASFAYIPAFNSSRMPVVAFGLFSSNLSSSRRVQKLFRYKTQVFSSYEGLLRSGIRAVILTLPNHLHYQNIIKALESGLDVFCEKPVTNNLGDAVRIQEYLARTKNILMVGFNQRYLDRIKKIKSLIENNELGEIYEVNAYHNQNIVGHLKRSGWLNDSKKSGGGVLYNAGIHLVNLMLYFFGPVESVTAKLQYKEIPKDFGEDTADCDFNFKSGVTGRISASYLNEVNSSYEHFIIRGGKGEIYSDMKTSSIMLKPVGASRWKSVSCNKEVVADSVFNELLHFNNCIEARLCPDTDILDSINTQRVIEAAYQASVEKRRIFVK